MARRYDHSRDEIKKMTIKAGREIIIAEGFHSLSTRKIADKIGYTAGTLYNVFENFNDIAFHINAITIQEMEDYIITKCKNKKGIEGLKSFARSYISFLFKTPNIGDAIYELILPENEAMPKFYQEQTVKLFNKLNNLLKETLGTSAKEAKDHSCVFWATLYGTYYLSRRGRLCAVENNDPYKIADKFIDRYIAGIRSNMS
ncbi:MAG: TetR/AcrR family transcriptional regulator [Alphaproteobacteria bacterium]|nr:TetR/AcrR family transcriptional regulator [Alphaproteobacteria bacterium]